MIAGIGLLQPTSELGVVLRMGLAVLVGGLIGWERELDRKPAGLRTHMLVSLGSALFVLTSIQTGMVQQDRADTPQSSHAGHYHWHRFFRGWGNRNSIVRSLRWNPSQRADVCCRDLGVSVFGCRGSLWFVENRTAGGNFDVYYSSSC